MFRTINILILVSLLNACGVSEPAKLAQPLSKERTQRTESAPAEFDSEFSQAPAEARRYSEDWIIKRSTDEFGAFDGPVQIESNFRPQSDSGNYKIGFHINLNGLMEVLVNRVDGNDAYESTEAPRAVSRRYAGREAQNRSFEKINEWTKANEAMVTVSVTEGKTLTERLRLLNNKIQIGTNHKLNQFLKQCFLRDVNFSIAIKTAKLLPDDSTFRGIQLTGYQQKAKELQDMIQQRGSTQ